MHGGSPIAIFTNPSWWSEGHGRGWRPVTTLSFAVNYAVHGLAPFGYHVVNVVLHALVSVLLFDVLVKLGVLLSAAGVAAALFAAHPIHTEAVASVVGRAELLTAVGFFLSWRLFLAADAPGTRGFGRGAAIPPSAWEALACVVYFVALLAKENVLALVPVMVLADALYPRRSTTETDEARAGLGAVVARLPMRRYAMLAVTTVVFVACRAAVLGGGTPGIDVLDNPLVAMPLGERVLTAVKVVALCAWRLIFPLELSADYSFDQITAVRSPLDPLFLAGSVILVAIPTLIWWAGRRAPEVALGAGLMTFSFFLVSNLVFQIGTIMGERLLYLPSAGFCLMLAGAIARLASVGAAATHRAALPRVAVVVTAVVVALYGVRTWTRNDVWSDSLRFFTAMVADAPRSARSHRELGAILAERGRSEEARREFERSLAIKPGDAATLYNLGNAHLQAGRVEEAIESYRNALAVKPDFASAMVNLGNAESMRGDQHAALEWMRRAVDLTPRSGLPSLRMNIANTLFRMGAREEARAEYEAALALAPDASDTLTNYGAFLYAGGEYAEASRVYERAARSPTPASLVGLAASYRAQGMIQKAREVQARAEQLFPADASVRRMSEILRRDAEGGGGSPS